MPGIFVQPHTFARPQKHARPLIDTNDTVLARALDALEPCEKQTAGTPDPCLSERQFDPTKPPDLSHTRLLKAAIDGRTLEKPNWHSLLLQTVSSVASVAESCEELQRMCPVGMVKGRFEENGHVFLPTTGISVQRTNSNRIARAVIDACRALGLDLDLLFEWRSTARNNAASVAGSACRRDGRYNQ